MTSDFSFEAIKRGVEELPEPKVTEQDIDFVLDTIQKEAKHDKPSIKQLFFGIREVCLKELKKNLTNNVCIRD
jgi:glycerol-3-phosphate dehydrogenase